MQLWKHFWRSVALQHVVCRTPTLTDTLLPAGAAILPPEVMHQNDASQTSQIVGITGVRAARFGSPSWRWGIYSQLIGFRRCGVQSQDHVDPGAPSGSAALCAVSFIGWF